MKQIRVIEEDRWWRFQCPATGDELRIPRDGRWSFNGDLERPTFSPSLNQIQGFAGDSLEDLNKGRVAARNHCFVRNGFIEYLSDCTHNKAGQTLEIEPLSEVQMARYYPALLD